MPRRLDDETQRALAELLRCQAQVISRPQLHDLGLSDSVIRARLASSLWQRGFPGTYVAHNGQLAYVSRVWSALLYAGRGALASYSTSAYLHGLTNVPPATVHITVGSTRRVLGQPGLVVHLSKRAAD
jgi:predicted transcriptional regulator of viral defense system